MTQDSNGPRGETEAHEALDRCRGVVAQLQARVRDLERQLHAPAPPARMRILVTGGSGNVGRIVCRRLAERHEVVNFDLRPPDDRVGPFIRGDILNSAHLMAAVKGMDAVVHLAAIPHPHFDPPDAIMNANVMGTQRVVEAAALGDPKRLVFASSEATYGFVFGRDQIMPEYLPVDEQHPTRPLDPYGLSKVLGEQICRRYSRDTGLETVCLRYCWVWSPDGYGHLAAWADDPASFARNLWGYVDARDVAQAVEKALTAPGISHETLLISAANTFQRTPSQELIRRHLPEGVRVREGWFQGQPRRTLLDWSRAAEVIGYQPEYDCWQEAGLLT